MTAIVEDWSQRSIAVAPSSVYTLLVDRLPPSLTTTDLRPTAPRSDFTLGADPTLAGARKLAP
jgi:hypothetical protein